MKTILALVFVVLVAMFMPLNSAEAQNADASKTGATVPTPPSSSVANPDKVKQEKALASSNLSDATMPTWVPSGVLVLVLSIFLIGAGMSIKKLKSGFLTEALSEKTAPAPPPTPPATPPPATPPPAPASSSRLIAFLGMLAMLSMFVGMGFYLLWALFTGRVSEAVEASKAMGSYFLYGSALFAPYAFNQLKDAIKS